MKDLTDEQIATELELALKKQAEQDRDRHQTGARYRELRDEKERRIKHRLTLLSDQELAADPDPDIDPVTHALIENEITRRKKARKAALRKLAKQPLAAVTTAGLLEMAADITGLSEPQVDALLKELSDRHRPIQRAINRLSQARKRLREVKDVSPLRVVT